MVVAVEQKTMLIAGGIADQPAWFVSLLAWFGPAYEGLKFMSRVRMFVGDDDKKARQPTGRGTPGKHK